MDSVKAIVITTTGTYRDVTIYKFEGITTEDIIKQMECLGIYHITGIIEF